MPLSKAQKRMLDIYASTPASIDRDFYKATACGGHATFNPDGTIKITTIVEGSSAEYEAVIDSNATMADIRSAVGWMESWVDEVRINR